MLLLDLLQHELATAMKRKDLLRAQALRSVKAALQAEVRGRLDTLPEAEVRRLLGRHRVRLKALMLAYAQLGAKGEGIADALVHELAVCDQLLPVLDAGALATLLHAIAKTVERPSVGRLLGALVKAAPGQVDVPVAQVMAQRLLPS